MQISAKQIRRTFFMGVVLFATLYACNSLLYKYDPAAEKVENHLRNDVQLNSRIGKLQAIELYGRTIVAPSDTRSGYGIYRYYVEGDLSRARVAVQASDRDASGTFSVFRTTQIEEY